MQENPVWLHEMLDDLKRKAKSWPPDKYFEHVDKLVEASRRHIESSENERVRESLIELYQGIIRYAFACQIQALSIKDPGCSSIGMSASC